MLEKIISSSIIVSSSRSTSAARSAAIGSLRNSVAFAFDLASHCCRRISTLWSSLMSGSCGGCFLVFFRKVTFLRFYHPPLMAEASSYL